jgi:hypothetical protein
LNVIEQWNGANDFVSSARRGELASNRRGDHEVSMLALHLLQDCMVYVNTLMLQQVLAKPGRRQKLEPRDLSALTEVFRRMWLIPLLADRASAGGLKVSPMQIAAQILEDAMTGRPEQ